MVMVAVEGAVFEMLVGLLEVCQTGEECRKRAGACVSGSDVWRPSLLMYTYVYVCVFGHVGACLHV